MAKRVTEGHMELHEFDREAVLQAYVMKRLKEIPNSKFFKIADKFTSGISDIIGCVNGRFVAIELKVKKNKATPLQENFIAQVWYAGGVGGVAYNWGMVKNILNRAGAELTIESDAVDFKLN